MSFSLKDEHSDDFFEAILKLDTIEECYDFFEDLCTIKEIQSFIQRWQVAKMLKSGVIYADIVKITGASTATISRVNRCLTYGSGGYKHMLEKENIDEK